MYISWTGMMVRKYLGFLQLRWIRYLMFSDADTGAIWN